jgi:hypothetical protein
MSGMRLRDARLCLDCEEIHQDEICPICGSESFAYISRWVPVPDPDRAPRPASSAPEAEVYRQLLGKETPAQKSQKRRGFKGGLLGLTALGLAGWAWRSSRPGDKDNS